MHVSASIAIYAVSDLTKEQMSGAAQEIRDSIQNAWSGSFQQDGVTYNVTTQVSVQVVDSFQAGVASGAQNVIGLHLGNISSSVSSQTDLRNPTGPDTGIWNYNSLTDSPHEFGHLLGLDDTDSGSTIMNHIAQDYGAATPGDLQSALTEVITTHNQINALTDYGEAGEVARGRRVPQPLGTSTQTLHSMWVSLHNSLHHPWWKY